MSEVDLFQSPGGAIRGPKPQHMSHYEYCCRSSKEESVDARLFWQRCFTEFPPDHKKELANRFASRDFMQHAGAAFELFFHSFLIRTGCTVEGYELPAGSKSGGPDFLVRTPDCGLTLLEITSVFPSASRAVSDRVKAAIFQEAGRDLDSELVWISLRFGGSPARTPSVARVVSKIRRHLASWDAEIRASRGFIPEPIEIVEKGLKIHVEPHLKKPGETLPTMVFYGGDATLCRADDAIASALRNKAKKPYKQTGLPYVVVLNVIEVGLDIEEILNALLGKEQLRVFLDQDRNAAGHQVVRHHKGIWQFRGEPSNTRLTAVMVFRNICCLDYTPATPISFYHPFITDPRPLCSLSCITRYIVDDKGEQYLKHDGAGFSGVMNP